MTRHEFGRPGAASSMIDRVEKWRKASFLAGIALAGWLVSMPPATAQSSSGAADPAGSGSRDAGPIGDSQETGAEETGAEETGGQNTGGQDANDEEAGAGNNATDVQIAQAIDDLQNNRFNRRHAAFLVLVRSGPDAIPALESGARAKESEVSMRCVEALAHIARDKQHRSSVLDALQRLAADPEYPFAGLANRHIKYLTMSNEERAIEALTAEGSQLHKSQDGTIFSATVMRDRQMAWLRHLPGLRSVNIVGVGVTDKGLEHLAEVKTLTSIMISQSSITDAGLRKVEAIPSLTSLSLRGSEFTGRGLRQLKHAAKLSTLSVFSSVDDDDLQGLIEVQQLNHLSLSSVSISPKTVGLLNQLKHLRQCTVTVSAADDNVLQWIADVRVPIMLNLSQSTPVTAQGWRYLRQSTLEGLTVSGVVLDNPAMEHISKIETLKRLQLVNSNMTFTDEGLEHLQQLKSLEMLYIRGAKVSDAAVDRLKKALPKLRSVYVRK